LRILLVDDSDLVRRGIRTILADQSQYVICDEAEDAEQGIAKAKEKHPDLVLLDVSLPRGSGIEAARSIRREVPEIKVLLISQTDGAVLREQAAQARADGYVRKHYLAQDLIPALEKLSSAGVSDAAVKAPTVWLQGGGDMGDLIRKKDWSNTPLGPVESWSPTLRVIVQLLLANRFPQLLWWGPEFYCLYNDAYIPILGSKHPWALGRPNSEVWHEIWDTLRPLIETPFHGGPATWMEDIPLELKRRGFVEETHFTIAYSAVPDEKAEGGIGGVLATVHEITEKVIGERRVRMLRDLGVRSAEPKSNEEACRIAEEEIARYAKDVPFALLYLLNEKRDTGQLVCSPGMTPGSSSDVKEIRIESGDHVWPVGEALRNDKIVVVQGLQERLRDVPKGPWLDPPSAAAIVPIRSNLAHQPVGFMIAGLSSRVEFDEKYNDFLELLSSQVATMIANARAYEEERKRTEALAEIDRAKTAFFSNVSHEFRTPLTLLLGPLQDLLSGDQGQLSEAVTDQLHMMNRNGARLLRLVNTLLEFSRIEAGRVEAVYQATDLEAFTSELASTFESATEQAGLKLVVKCGGVGEPVYVDRHMWEKIVLNLISNAFKFTFDGEIVVTVQRVGNEAELRVRDTGVGIPAEEIPRLFERFHRVPNTRSRTYEGSGIGLALVNGLVKLHGGSMSVESTVDQGSTFIVRIPLGQEHLSGNVKHAAETTSTVAGATPFVNEALGWLPDGKKQADAPIDEGVPMAITTSDTERQELPSILIADDNADMRQYLSRLLSDRYQIEAVADGQAAWEAMQRRRPALILSDVMMPRMNGLELLERVRADSQLKDIPIILLSARAGEESRIEGLSSGTDDYLVKPFSARELMARVEAHIKISRVRQQAQIEQSRLAKEYESLFNQAPIGILLIDSEFRVRQINPAAMPEFRNIPNPIGRNYHEVLRSMLAEDSAREIVEIFRRTLETGVPYATFERPSQRIDRKEMGYYDWRVDRIALPEGGYGVVCYFRDSSLHVKARLAVAESQERYRQLTETLEDQVKARTQEVERRNAEIEKQAGQLQELSSRLLKIQDDERRRVARELHDSAGQTLTALGMNLAVIAAELKTGSPNLARHVAESEDLIQHLHQEIRTTSYLLHPPLLDESGLYSALEWYVQGVMQRSELEITLEITREFGRLPRDMELMIFRLVQESINNIHRHAGSKTASIRCMRSAQDVLLVVQDQGKGISKERLAEIPGRAAGVGIVGMRERLRQYGGELRLESDSSGTRVSMRIPLKSEEPTRQNEIRETAASSPATVSNLPRSA